MAETQADNEEHDAILKMRMDAMLNSSPASFLSLVGALFAVYVYWSPSTAIPLIAWQLVITAVAVTNLVSTVLYARNRPQRWGARSWARFVCVMHLVSGLAWGVGGAWMLTFANENQAVLTLSIGMAAVTVSIPSVVHLRAYNLFHLPIFWTYALGLALSTLQFKWLIASGFFLMGAFAIIIGRALAATSFPTRCICRWKTSGWPSGSRIVARNWRPPTGSSRSKATPIRLPALPIGAV